MDYPKRDDLFEGKFTDGNPVAGIAASRDNAAQMNAVYDEIRAAIQAGGLTPDADDLTQLSASIRKQVRSKQGFNVSGDANAIVLTSVAGKPKVTELEDFDEIQFMVSATNTSASVTVKVDGLAPIALSSVVAANQLFVGSLVTLVYLQGRFQLKQAVNPKTGSQVSDIGKLITDSLDIMEVGEVALNGASLSRSEHPILWAKVQATSNLVDQGKKNADQKTYAGYYGTGDGSTTFTLPIVGGEFIRMFDDGRGVDKGRVFGSWSSDEIKSHRHGIITADVYNPASAFVINDNSGDFIVSSDNISRGANATVRPGRYITEYAGSSETRPRSITFYGKTRL